MSAEVIRRRLELTRHSGMAWESADPSFVTAIESRYLAASRAGSGGERSTHRSRLAAAIYAADPTNGGLRYRALALETRRELEARLTRYDQPHR